MFRHVTMRFYYVIIMRLLCCVRMDSNHRSSAYETDEITTSPLRNVRPILTNRAFQFMNFFSVCYLFKANLKRYQFHNNIRVCTKHKNTRLSLAVCLFTPFLN